MTRAATLTTPGRRERKKQATRAAIRRAALTVALDEGLEGLTVDKISDAADVSPRTFFNYFSCKEDALVSDNAEATTALREAIAARPADEPVLHALRAAFCDAGFLDAVQDHRQDMLARHRLVQENPSLLPPQLAQYATFEEAVSAAIAERLGVEPEQDLRPALFASLGVTVIRLAIRRWAFDGANRLDQLFAELFGLLETELARPRPDEAHPCDGRALPTGK